jgi:HlyD family secretion protein
MEKGIFIVAVLLVLIGCRRGTTDADAYGNFESTEVTISSETTGRIIKSGISEGDKLTAGDTVAVTDTTMLLLLRDEIDAGIKSVSTRIASVNAQNEILKQQIENIRINIRRVSEMLKDNAATQKQLDDLTGQVEVLKRQIDANNTQKASIVAEMNVLTSKKATVNESLKRSTVLCPLSGTVTAKYFDVGELTSPGKPLVKVADLSVMKLRVYVSGSQLGSVKTGMKCTVRTDKGSNGYTNYEGTVTHIAEKAEFTPKIIQTKEERVNLVYAVIIETPNDGGIKSGMPGEAIFSQTASN